MGIVASDGGMDASMLGRDEAIELLGVFLKYSSAEAQGIADAIETALVD